MKWLSLGRLKKGFIYYLEDEGGEKKVSFQFISLVRGKELEFQFFDDKIF